MNVRWAPAVLLLCCALVDAYHDHQTCLNEPEVFPKKYFFFKGKSLTITLDTSSRVTHQLSTEVFYIYLKEYLGYPKIVVEKNDDNFQVLPVIKRLSDYYNPDISVPPATINMEVWVRPDYNEAMSQFVRECGTIGPPGRFGWFIPADLNKPLMAYYSRHRWSENIQEVHWSIFVDPMMVQPFDISKSVLHTLQEQFARVNGTGEFFCNDTRVCNRGMYIPNRCLDEACAVLLAPEFQVSSFLIDQIEEMKLLVKVLWLGDNLKSAVDELTYSLRNTTQSIVFFYWYPSHVVVDQKKFFSVVFTNNEIMNFTHDSSVGYKYEMHRLVKLAWGKIAEYAKPLYESLTSFRLEEEDYFYMLNMHDKYPEMPIREIACNWMLYNNKTWRRWKKDYPTQIYIGGIFPMEATSYNGRGIALGALMAKDAVNQNQTILPGYNLLLILQDGKCKADNVMKHFIDFIVEGYYPKLVGLLGPACSETVEPLAGVSRHYHIMTISYSAEGASFSDRKKYPYFFRTIGENNHYKHVYLNLLKHFGWKRVAALTEDGQKYTEYISLMQDDLEKNNITFIANKKFPRERETEAMTRYLEDLKSKRARIIIADVVDDVARTVMCEAYKLEMTAAQGYVWFLPMWLNDTFYHTEYFNVYRNENVNCSTREMIKAISGYFSMTHAYFAPNDSIMQENVTVKEWREKYQARAKSHASDYAGFAYDAVWTYALALDKLAKTDAEALSDLHSENTTNKLVRLVEETDFHGVSGRIKFRGGPSRFSVINIMQWYDGSIHNIGHFYPNLSDSKPEILGGELKLNKSAIRWFTPEGTKPEDGSLPPEECGIEFLKNLLGTTCPTTWSVFHGSMATITIILVIIIAILVTRKYQKKMEQTKNYIRALGLTFDLHNTSDLDKWEISRESVVINRKLGEGAFGTVYGGEANLLDTGWCAVAVKTLKLGSTTEEKLDFLSEAEVMKRFEHKNIVKLLGVCTKEEPIYTIMEFMLYGDLKTYLLARRNLVNKNSDESEEVSPKRLTSMALDVARGLSYLAELKYVHRDVASRNCLVNAQRCVKLGDFGMTRAMFDNDYYKFTRKGMLPVRWMSPESLELGVFTTHSDVWSYGVLLFEIITFGSFPFQGKSNAQVLELVKAGHTLSIPKGLKPQLEGLIKSCWNRDSKLRPAASEIVEFLANNPRLLAPCLDVPLSSVQLEGSDQAELNVPTEFRKCSTSSKSSPAKPTCTIPMEQLMPFYQPPEDKSDSESIPMEQACPKEPLLGTAKSSSSLLNLGKFVQRKKDEDNDDYVPTDRPGMPQKQDPSSKI